MFSSQLIKNPIFFIGVPRSGTTIIFEAFSVHEDLGWFSNWFELFPRLSTLALFSRVADWNVLRGEKKQSQTHMAKRYLPHPSECYPVWEHLCGKKFVFDFLLDQTAEARERQNARQFIRKVIRFQGKPRFASKLTGPSRMNYLSSIFPDAVFIHIIRDGRAVANSLMNVKFWKNRGGYDKPLWNNGLSDQDLGIIEKFHKSPITLAAVQWKRIIYIARKESKRLPKNRYYEVQYEQFIEDPLGCMTSILEHCELGSSNRIDRYMKRIDYKNMNFKYLQTMDKEDIRILNDIMGDLLEDLGYVVN